MQLCMRVERKRQLQLFPIKEIGELFLKASRGNIVYGIVINVPPWLIGNRFKTFRAHSTCQVSWIRIAKLDFNKFQYLGLWLGTAVIIYWCTLQMFSLSVTVVPLLQLDVYCKAYAGMWCISYKWWGSNVHCLAVIQPADLLIVTLHRDVFVTLVNR